MKRPPRKQFLTGHVGNLWRQKLKAQPLYCVIGTNHDGKTVEVLRPAIDAHRAATYAVMAAESGRFTGVTVHAIDLRSAAGPRSKPVDLAAEDRQIRKSANSPLAAYVVRIVTIDETDQHKATVDTMPVLETSDLVAAQAWANCFNDTELEDAAGAYAIVQAVRTK